MGILITGGSGFFGSYLIKELVDEEQVFIYDLFVDLGLLSFLLGEKVSKVKIITGDIQDLPLLMRTIKEHRVKKVVHLASLLSPTSRENPHLAIKVNCLGTANIFEAGRILGVEKIVWASSISVFSSQEEELSNDAPYRPWGIYGACKAFDESLAAFYSSEYGLDITGLRFPIVYGEGVGPGFAGTLTKELILKPALGESGEVPCGDDTLNWLYVKDVATAFVFALKAKKPKTISFNATGEQRSVKEAREIVLKHIPDAHLELKPGVSGLPLRFDTKPLEAEVGFKPLFTLDEGIRDTIKMVRRRYGKGD